MEKNYHQLHKCLHFAHFHLTNFKKFWTSILDNQMKIIQHRFLKPFSWIGITAEQIFILKFIWIPFKNWKLKYDQEKHI